MDLALYLENRWRSEKVNGEKLLEKCLQIRWCRCFFDATYIIAVNEHFRKSVNPLYLKN